MNTTPAPMVVVSHPAQDVYKLVEDDEMDKKVLAKLAELQVGDWHQGPSARKLLDVLEAVLKSEPKLGQKWLSGDRISQIPAEVWTAVEEGWRTGSFKRLCTLILLCNLQDPGSGAKLTIDPDHVAIAETMTNTYRGVYVDTFARYLRENHSYFNEPARTYYAKFCAITQSSGTGKTRLLLELGKELIVLYINVRSTRDMEYPPRDTIPAQILTDTLWCSAEAYSHRCRIFFATVFKCLADFCSQNPDHLGVLSCVGHKTREEFFENFDAEFKKLKKEPNAQEVMYAHCRQLRDCLKGQNGRNTDAPMVVIALDDAQVLHEKKDGYVPADVLLQTIKEYSEEHRDVSVWVVFASTAPQIAYFAPFLSLFPLPRAHVGEQLLFRPFTALGWDQHRPMLNEIKLDKVSWGSHLLRYGRPLWWSLKKSGYSVRHIVDLAGQKLCASPTFKLTDDHQVLAVLGQRFCLDIAFGRHNALQYNDTLVANHMRVCVNTTENGLWSYTAYPCEPILSVAAAELLYREEKNLGGALRTVLDMVNVGLVNDGDTGELAGRFLWLLAKDFCVHAGLEKQISTEKAGWDDEDLSYCRPVPVVEFLKLTFGPEILKRAPGAREIFEDAFINFSHWIQMESDITQGIENEVPFDKWTAMLWARTCALQCHRDQPVVDKVIPIYFKSRPRKHAFSHILISDKARESSQYGLADKITRQHESITPGYQGPPYIVILVDFGLSDSAINVRDETKTSDPCLRIDAAALDTKTFPFLKEGIAGSLRDLYGCSMASSGTSLEDLGRQVRFGVARQHCLMNTKQQGDNDDHDSDDNVSNKREGGGEDGDAKEEEEKVPRKRTKVCRFAKALRKLTAVGRKKV